MTIPTIPPYEPSFKPVPTVTPFTYRDGVTMLKKLDGMVRYINLVIIPFINNNFEALADEVEADIDNMIQLVNEAIDSVINSSVTVQDAVVAGIFENPASATRVYTDTLYAAKSAVTAIEDLVNTGRLSEAALDAAYTTKELGDTLNDLVTTGRLSATELDARYALNSALNADKHVIVVRARTGAEIDDGNAFNEALTIANGSGGIIVFPTDRDIILPGGHVREVGVCIDFGGNNVSHTGNNTMLSLTHIGPDLEFCAGNGWVQNGKITGNIGNVAKCFELGNSWGFNFRNVEIKNYSNGIGIHLRNRINWCEGVIFDNVMINDCKYAVRFSRDANPPLYVAAPPTESFAYLNFLNLSINIPDGGFGLDFAGTATETIFVYNGFIRLRAWLYGTGTLVRITTGTNVSMMNVDISGEGATTAKMFEAPGGNFVARGRLSIADNMTRVNGAGKVVIITSGDNVIPIDTVGGTAANGHTFNRVAAYAPDAGFHPQIGYELANGFESVFVAGYNQGAALRAYGVPFGGSVGPDGVMWFSAESGRIYVGEAAGGMYITSGLGSPEGVILANRGSMYLRRDGGATTTLYVKSTDSVNTGWIAK